MSRKTNAKNPDVGHVPSHVAIIMDGNGRWAQQKRLSRIKGHRKGLDAVKEIVESAGEIGIKILSLYAFSKENWQRPEDEVEELMRLLQQYLVDSRKDLMEQHVRLNAIGDLEDLPPAVLDTLRETVAMTRRNTGLVLNLALSYGGRSEIVSAINRLVKDLHNGNIDGDRVTPEVFSRYLFTHDLPDPDLLIRTSGEQRISNFLLWQIAYTELYFTPTLWPDFGKEEFLRALEDYRSRERRFGLISSQLKEDHIR
jgi:undecaprenyl diphosphate synthase